MAARVPRHNKAPALYQGRGFRFQLRTRLAALGTAYPSVSDKDNQVAAKLVLPGDKKVVRDAAANARSLLLAVGVQAIQVGHQRGTLGRGYGVERVRRCFAPLGI
ncbi:hypothetical protein GCM10028824_43170 [Hymenobacter segetis]